VGVRVGVADPVAAGVRVRVRVGVAVGPAPGQSWLCGTICLGWLALDQPRMTPAARFSSVSRSPPPRPFHVGRALALVGGNSP
jgi:hypothetical protein